MFKPLAIVLWAGCLGASITAGTAMLAQAEDLLELPPMPGISPGILPPQQPPAPVATPPIAPAVPVPPVTADRRLEISLSRRRLTLFQGQTVLRQYPIAVGKAGWETPVGQFKVMQMYENPPWRNPFTGAVIPGGATDNPLGRRWIGFWTDGKNWVGMHGTPNPGSVGRAASHGCIRMFNRDIEELFTKVALGTPVRVVR